MLESFGFVSTPAGRIHPDFPHCIVVCESFHYVVQSNSEDAIECAAFVEDCLAELCAAEFKILAEVGYEVEKMSKVLRRVTRDTRVDYRISLVTANGPIISVEYDEWHQRHAYVVHGKTGGRAATFDDIWQFLPPIYAKYLAQSAN